MTRDLGSVLDSAGESSRPSSRCQKGSEASNTQSTWSYLENVIMAHRTMFIVPGCSFLLHTLEAGQDVMGNEMKWSSLSRFFLPYGTKGRGLG